MKKLALCILMITALLGAACAGGAPAKETDYGTVISEMTPIINKAMQENMVTGLAVALVDGQKTVWAQGFGYADLEKGIPAKADTVFEIGSNSKTIAATAVMQLAERGKLDIDRPLVTYVPGFSIKQRFPESGPITVRSVMTHRSGIPGDIFVNGWTHSGYDRTWLPWLIEYLKGEYTAFPVGYAFAYSNAAVCLLELVIANAAGQSFESYTDGLFGSMGMKDSTFLYNKPLPPERVSQGYCLNKRVDQVYDNGPTAGSVRSTVLDMAEYMKMVLSGGGKVLKPETLNQMVTRQNGNSPADFDTSIGLNWLLSDTEMSYAGRIAYHDGATVVMMSRCEVLLDHGLGIVVLTNSATGTAAHETIVREGLKRALQAKKGIAPAEPAALPPSPEVQLSPDRLKAYEGLYVGELGTTPVKAVAGALELELGGKVTRAFPLQNGRFRAATGTEIGFQDVGGRTILTATVPGPFTQRVAAKYVPPPIPAAWKARYGYYEIGNLSPDDSANFVPPEVALTKKTMKLFEKDGLLIMGETLRQDTAIEPVSDTLAFTAGLGRNRGESVQVLNPGPGEQIQFWGCKYKRVKGL